MHFLKLRTKLAWDSFAYTKSRKSATKNIISVTIAIVLSVLASLLIAVAVGYNPGTIIQQLFTKGFVDWHKLIFNIVILGVGALAFSFAFRAGVFNIGITGQMLAAGLAVLVVSTALQNVYFPQGSGQVFMLIIAIAAGGLVATVVAALKVYLKVNEVISSILINWIMFFVVRLIVQKFYSDPSQLLTQSYDIPEQFRLVAPGIGGWLPALIILIVLTALMMIIIKFTVYGHKVVAVGNSITASRYAGYNVKAVNISTMTISGAIAGILAYILYTSGETPSIPVSASVNALPSEGMNGIAIGLIAMSNPIAILPVAFIIGLFQSSAPFLSTPVAFSNLIIGFVILGAALFVILLRYKPWLWMKQKLYGYYAPKYYQTFENDMESLVSKYKSKISTISTENRHNHKDLATSSELEYINGFYEYKKYLEQIGWNRVTDAQYKKYIEWEYQVNRLVLAATKGQKPVMKMPASHVNWSALGEQLYREYLAERKAMVAQYRKHMLVVKATQFFFPLVEAKNIINVKNHNCDVQFIKYKARKINQIQKLEEEISVTDSEAKKQHCQAKIDKLVKDIEKNQQQLFAWKAKNEKLMNAWYIKKSRTFGSLEKHHSNFLRKAERLNLDANEKALVVEWVNDSYKEALENQGEGAR